MYLFLIETSCLGIVESPHPYTNSYTQNTLVSCSRAYSYSISFDGSSATESGYDYLKIYRGSSTSDSDKLYTNSGASWPVVTYQSTSGLTFYFTTDSSAVYWGYKAYITPSCNQGIIASLTERFGND
jgi:hypothetical protein